MNVTPATVRVAPRPRVIVTHNERSPMTQTLASALGLSVTTRPVVR